MQPFPIQEVSVSIPANKRLRQRTALVASADRSFRERLSQVLAGLRWQVRESASGAEAWSEAESLRPRRSSSTLGCPILI